MCRSSSRAWGITILLVAACLVYACKPRNTDIASKTLLVGGKLDEENLYPSSVLLLVGHEVCTAARVAHDKLLTAGHCLIEEFQPQRPIKAAAKIGSQLYIYSGPQFIYDRSLGTASYSYRFKVKNLHIHHSYRYHSLYMSEPQASADIAVIEIEHVQRPIRQEGSSPNWEPVAEIPRSDVPIAKLFTDRSIQPGEPVIIGGYGCELITEQNRRQGYKTRRKYANTSAADPELAFQLSLTTSAAFLRYELDDMYVPTPAVFFDAAAAVNEEKAISPEIVARIYQEEKVPTLCPGDSGGPLYATHDGELAIVGVNSRYRNSSQVELQAITEAISEREQSALGNRIENFPTVNLHTRIDREAFPRVDRWLDRILADQRPPAGILFYYHFPFAYDALAASGLGADPMETKADLRPRGTEFWLTVSGTKGPCPHRPSEVWVTGEDGQEIELKKMSVGRFGTEGAPIVPVAFRVEMESTSSSSDPQAPCAVSIYSAR